MTQVNLKYRRTNGVDPEGVLLTVGQVLVSPAYRYDTSAGEMTTEPFQADMGATITLAPGTYLFDPQGVPDGRGGFIDMKAYRAVPASGTPIDVDDLTEVNPSGALLVGEEWKVYVDEAIATVTVGGSPGFIPAENITNSTAVGRAVVKAVDQAAARTAIAAAPTSNAAFTGTFSIPDGVLAIADTSGLQPALDAKAPLANPVFTGNPQGPTPTAGDADTSFATTAFVDLSFAKINSPVFTGTPAGPTPPAANSSTRFATTAWVKAEPLTLAQMPAGYAHYQQCPGGIQPNRPTARTDIYVVWMMINTPSTAAGKALPGVDFHMRIDT